MKSRVWWITAVVGTTVGVAGLILFAYATSPLAAAGLFLTLWGNNIDRTNRRLR